MARKREAHKEFTELQHINREIEITKAQITALKTKAEKDAHLGAEVPEATYLAGQYMNDTRDLIKKLEVSLQKRVAEQAQRMEYILAIPDSLTRQIFMLRFVEGMSLEQIEAFLKVPAGGIYTRIIRQIRGHR